jgi:hypothetical protein
MRMDQVRLVQANGRIRRRSWFRSWSFEQVLVRRAGGRQTLVRAGGPTSVMEAVWARRSRERFGLGRLFGLFGGGVTIRG